MLGALLVCQRYEIQPKPEHKLDKDHKADPVRQQIRPNRPNNLIRIMGPKPIYPNILHKQPLKTKLEQFPIYPPYVVIRNIS